MTGCPALDVPRPPFIPPPMPSPSGVLVHLRPAQIAAIRAAAPVAYVPWGAIEWHGVHAPVGLDGMQADGQCRALARETGGVVLPVVYAGTDTIGPFKGFPHSFEHAAATVEALAAELLDALAADGWRVVVVVTGHAGGGHTDALREAAQRFAARRPDVAVRVWTSFSLIQDVYPSNHAARGEVSFQLRFAPDTVDLTAIPDGPPPTLDGEGVWGEDPRLASAGEGEAMLRLFVERASAEVRPLLEEVRGPGAEGREQEGRAP